ncbi:MULTISPECIES: hypothetical protein [Pseudomonas]|uniref:Uncharacterized protein n=1 Tax=Pseudomonas lutea TaxID=243924 RepID=A0A9X8MH50_9PSED|nr:MULTISPECIES: hypothetical protein [Pseudomonas]SER37108.1 hypothetical protein SAMN05216409_11881 [Pseudomonas lutea]
MSLFKRLSTMSASEAYSQTTLPCGTRLEIEGAALYLVTDARIWMKPSQARKVLRRTDNTRSGFHLLRMAYLIASVFLMAAICTDVLDLASGVIPASSCPTITPTQIIITTVCVDMILARLVYLCILKAVNPFRRVSLLSF